MNRPETRIEHDHQHLTLLLRDLDGALERWHDDPNGEPEESPLEDARVALGLLKEDAFAHFEREEHGLFPNLVAEYPELGEDLDGLGVAHDEICEHLVSLEQSLNKATASQPSTDRAHLAAAAKRLGELFWRHTAVEWKIIRDLLERVDDERRGTIMKQLREI